MQKLVVFSLLFMLSMRSTWGSDYIASSLHQVESHKTDVRHNEIGSRRFVGCWPCIQQYLLGSYFEHQYSLLDSDFNGFLAEEFGSNNFCKEPANNVNFIVSSRLQRDLIGEGSHRHLASTLRFSVQSDANPWFDSQNCEAIIVERIPTGVFADPFELQHLVHGKVFLDAAVFGDANLELPSALSNRSIVEVHVDILHDASQGHHETVLKLPLHARYPPLDSSGYATVELGNPDLFLRCRPKGLHPEPCSWALFRIHAGSANGVTWKIPSGNDAHKGVVSSVTFASALLCALAIALSAIFSKVRLISGQ